MIGNKFENALMEHKIYSFNLRCSINHFFNHIVSFGGWDIIQAIIYKNPLLNNSIETNNELLFNIISSIDLFLIGIVLLIFGFGVYELFISEINFAKDKFADSTLKINSLDQLKNKIIKVIIIVLIVKFFEKVLKLSHNFTTPNDLILFSLSILAICIGYFLINRK